MPKKEVPVPKLNKYTNENFIIAPNMIDGDQGDDVEAMMTSGKSLQEGVSGKKSIDTLYENTSQTIVKNPRSATTSPAGLPDLGDYPHRRY